jgi:hypothetical protein
LPVIWADSAAEWAGHQPFAVAEWAAVASTVAAGWVADTVAVEWAAEEDTAVAVAAAIANWCIADIRVGRTPAQS